MEAIPTIFSTTEKEFNERLQKLSKISKELQIDIMDGKFVKSKSIPVQKIPYMFGSGKILEAHLMVKNPEEYVEPLRIRGFGRIIFHYEAVKNYDKIVALLKNIRSHGMHAVIAINPETKPEKLKPIIEQIHHVLIMGVKPGKENQKLMNETFNKIKWFKKNYPNIKLQVDGGINKETAKKLYKTGADILNSGSYVSKSKNPEKSLKELENGAWTNNNTKGKSKKA